MTSFHPRDFIQMASEKPVNHHSGLWLLSNLIFLAKHAPNSENDSIENSFRAVDNHLEKIDFADLLIDVNLKSVVGFYPCQVEQNDVT